MYYAYQYGTHHPDEKEKNIPGSTVSELRAVVFEVINDCNKCLKQVLADYYSAHIIFYKAIKDCC